MTLGMFVTLVLWALNIVFAVEAYKDNKKGDLAWHPFVVGFMTLGILQTITL